MDIIYENGFFLGVARTSLVPTDITEAGARHVAPRLCSDQPYQADSDGSGHDMVWLDLSARY